MFAEVLSILRVIEGGLPSARYSRRVKLEFISIVAFPIFITEKEKHK